MSENGLFIEQLKEPEGRDKWPAVDRAYDFVLPSYQLLATRFEAADTRISALLTLTSTLTIAVPIFAKNVQPGISFASPYFLLGMMFFLLSSVLGIIGRVSGGVMLPDPMVFYNENLQESEWEFKKNQIYWAGENFFTNAQAIRQKGNVATAMTIGLLVEVLAFAAWLAT